MPASWQKHDRHRGHKGSRSATIKGPLMPARTKWVRMVTSLSAGVQGKSDATLGQWVSSKFLKGHKAGRCMGNDLTEYSHAFGTRPAYDLL